MAGVQTALVVWAQAGHWPSGTSDTARGSRRPCGGAEASTPGGGPATVVPHATAAPSTRGAGAGSSTVTPAATRTATATSTPAPTSTPTATRTPTAPGTPT